MESNAASENEILLADVLFPPDGSRHGPGRALFQQRRASNREDARASSDLLHDLGGM